MRLLSHVAVFALLAGSLSAQELPDVCSALSNMSVGQWAEYRLTSSELPGGSATMRFAVVGTEEVDGKEHYWHETTMQGEMGGMIMQMLIPGYPYDDSEIARIIIKPENQPAMEMPSQMMGMMPQSAGGESPARGAAENCEEAELIGVETITVAGGTFETMHLKAADAQDADMWVRVGVPFGIVRFTDGAGNAMELVDHGDGATSSITEPPVKVPGR